MRIVKVWLYCLLFVCFLFVCMVMDFHAEDNASNVKFCMAVHQRPMQESPIFVNFAPPEVQNQTY